LQGEDVGYPPFVRARSKVDETLASDAWTPVVEGAGESEGGSASAPSLAAARRPTIFDVARAAGVSYSTVSRVVNGHEFVRERTRTRVQDAMAELGYVAHVTARALASGRTQAIGLLAQEIDNPFFSNIIKGVDQEVSSADYDLLLCTTHSRREKEAAYVARLSHGMVDGLVIVLPAGLPEYVATLAGERYPFVLVDHDSDAPGCDVVNAANRVGTKEGIAYLVGLGHRRIGFIGGRPDVGAALERRAGYEDALADAGIAFDPALVVSGDFMERRGRAAAHELLSRPRPPTAIFASSDAAAFGVLRAAEERGLEVPGDLSVLGFDDIVEAAYVGAALSTVRQPLREMGRVAVRRLLDRLADPRTEPGMRIVMETELIVRQTTASPGPRASSSRASRRGGGPG
jgi:LacI family transcriptional regulator